MESTKNGANLLQGDATPLALRRRRKKLIAIFSTFLIFIALIIVALITFLIYYSDSEAIDRTTTVDPSLKAFCSVVIGSTDSCLASFEPIIYTKPVTNPNQIFTLSLEIATEELGILTSILSSSTQSNFSGCSNSVREALNLINETFSSADQLRESNGYQRHGMITMIVAAEEDLKACADGLRKVESKTVGEAEEKMERAKMYLNYSRDFLSRYDDVSLVANASWRLLIMEVEENWFSVALLVSQFLFLCFLLCSILRIH